MFPDQVDIQMHDASQQATTLTFSSYDLRIGVEVPTGIPHPVVKETFPPGWTPIPAHNLNRRYRLEKAGKFGSRYALSINDGTRLRSAATLSGILDVLEGDIQIYVAEFATPHIFVHAGVVSWRGRAIVLPGSSLAGKSTLVTSLVAAGATYYSDEYAVLTPEGRVLPYQRRVSLRSGPHGPAGRRDLGHPAPAASESQHAMDVGLIALLRFQPETGWQTGPLTGAAAIMAICEHTVPIQRRPEDTLAILGKVVDSAHVIRGTRGDVDEAVERLLAMNATRKAIS